jgi:hypothetical protein
MVFAFGFLWPRNPLQFLLVVTFANDMDLEQVAVTNRFGFLPDFDYEFGCRTWRDVLPPDEPFEESHSHRLSRSDSDVCLHVRPIPVRRPRVAPSRFDGRRCCFSRAGLL